MGLDPLGGHLDALAALRFFFCRADDLTAGSPASPNETGGPQSSRTSFLDRAFLSMRKRDL